MSEILNEKSVRSKKIGAGRIIIGIIIIVGIFFGIMVANFRREFETNISNISVSGINLAKIPNGSYVGFHDAPPAIAAKVRVVVSNHKIKDIQIIYHKNGKGQKAERIVNEIIAAQSLKVDTITGATYSSKVILKAVQNALDSAGAN